MKDIIVKERHIKRELWIFLACIAAMEALNIYAVIRYDGAWTEVVTNIGFIITAALVVYMVSAFLRLLIYVTVRLFKKK